MKPTNCECAWAVAGLLMEQTPKYLLISDEALGEYYEPALQNFKDLFIKDFEAPAGFKQLVLDVVREYCDIKRTSYKL